MEDQAVAAAAREAAESSPVDRILDVLAQRVGSRAGTETVFGAPIERDGVTVVPVARVRWGFGGGAGRTDRPEGASAPVDAPTGSGSGGGGGLSAEPVGYIEIGPGGAAFRPIAQLPNPLFILAGGIAAGIVIRALARLAGR